MFGYLVKRLILAAFTLLTILLAIKNCNKPSKSLKRLVTSMLLRLVLVLIFGTAGWLNQ